MLVNLLNNEIDEKTYLQEYNARILKKQLPKKIYGFVFQYRGLYLIVLNKFVSEYKKQMTLLHEFAHIELSHLENKKELLEFKIENLEDEADKYVEFLLENIKKEVV